MKRLLATLGLGAAAIAATASAPVHATPSIPIPPPRLQAPDLKALKLRPAPKLTILSPLFLRAELTAEIHVQPTGIPGLRWVICVVRNLGMRNSGPFQTLLTRIYVGTPALPGPAVATPIAMNIPAGGLEVVYFLESAPLTVGLHSDHTKVVSEYSEINNSDSLFVVP